jgi:hypothetical protein
MTCDYLQLYVQYIVCYRKCNPNREASISAEEKWNKNSVHFDAMLSIKSMIVCGRALGESLLKVRQQGQEDLEEVLSSLTRFKQ